MNTPIRPQLLLEIRSAKADSYAFVDKSTGKNVSGRRIILQCEAANEDESEVLPVRVTCPLPADAGDDYTPPLHRGQRVLARLESFEIEKGQGLARISGLAALS